MNKKHGLFIGALFVGTFALTAAALMSANVLPETNYSYKTVAAQNSISWSGKIEGMVTNEHHGFEGDGYKFVTAKKHDADWHVQLFANNISTYTNEDYILTFTFTSNTTAPGGEGDGVILRAFDNVDDGGDLWRRYPVVNGENIIQGDYHSTSNMLNVELSLGEFRAEESEITVTRFEIRRRRDFTTTFNAEAWKDSPYASSVTSDPHENISSATFSFDNTKVEGNLESWRNKLQILTPITLKYGRTYEIHYDVEFNINISNCEIIHGRRPSDYVDKWQEGNMDGYYEQSFTLGEKRSFSFTVTPSLAATDFENIVFSIRPGEKKAGSVTFNNLSVRDISNMNEEVRVCELRSADKFAEQWRALRTNDELCAAGVITADVDAMRALIIVYDNMDADQRDLLSDITDVGDYKVAQSVAYFRAMLEN